MCGLDGMYLTPPAYPGCVVAQWVKQRNVLGEGGDTQRYKSGGDAAQQRAPAFALIVPTLRVVTQCLTLCVLGDFEVGCISVSAVVGVMGFAPYGRPTYFRESRQTVCSWLGASFVGLPSTPAPFRGHAVMGRPWPAWLSRLLPLIPLHDTCARPGALTSRSAVSGPWRKRIKIKSFGWTPPRSSTACRRGRPQDRPRRQAGLLRVNDLNLVGARLPAMALVHPTLFHRMYRPFAGKRAPTVPGMASALLRFRVWQDRSRRRAVLPQATEACSFTSRSGLSSGVTPSITASTPNNNSYPNPYPPVTSLNTPKQIGPSAAIR